MGTRCPRSDELALHNIVTSSKPKKASIASWSTVRIRSCRVTFTNISLIALKVIIVALDLYWDATQNKGSLSEYALFTNTTDINNHYLKLIWGGGVKYSWKKVRRSFKHNNPIPQGVSTNVGNLHNFTLTRFIRRYAPPSRLRRKPGLLSPSRNHM